MKYCTRRGGGNTCRLLSFFPFSLLYSLASLQLANFSQHVPPSCCAANFFIIYSLVLFLIEKDKKNKFFFYFCGLFSYHYVLLFVRFFFFLVHLFRNCFLLHFILCFVILLSVPHLFLYVSCSLFIKFFHYVSFLFMHSLFVSLPFTIFPPYFFSILYCSFCFISI